MHLLNLPLGRESLVHRTSPIKRITRNGIEWRVCCLYAGDIFASAIGESRQRADENEASAAEDHDKNLTQDDLLLL
jgi:hypothetical protein